MEKEQEFYKVSKKLDATEKKLDNMYNKRSKIKDEAGKQKMNAEIMELMQKVQVLRAEKKQLEIQLHHLYYAEEIKKINSQYN